MTALGINMTDREPTYGWESITPTRRPVSTYRRMANTLWKRRDEVIEDGLAAGELDHELIEEIGKAALILDGLARGTTVIVIERCCCREWMGDELGCKIHNQSLAETEAAS